jgi:Ca2+-binding RTX toxin-like protein
MDFEPNDTEQDAEGRGILSRVLNGGSINDFLTGDVAIVSLSGPADPNDVYQYTTSPGLLRLELSVLGPGTFDLSALGEAGVSGVSGQFTVFGSGSFSGNFTVRGENGIRAYGDEYFQLLNDISNLQTIIGGELLDDLGEGVADPAMQGDAERVNELESLVFSMQETNTVNVDTSALANDFASRLVSYTQGSEYIDDIRSLLERAEDIARDWATPVYSVFNFEANEWNETDIFSFGLFEWNGVPGLQTGYITVTGGSTSLQASIGYAGETFRPVDYSIGINVMREFVVIWEGDEDDDLNVGDASDELMSGLGGTDFLYGGFGSDAIFGGADTDALFGGEDDDELFGEAGDDGLDGGLGDDTLDGGAGVDWLFGREDNDVLRGGSETDALFGNEGDDFLQGDDGDDGLDGGAGNDTLEGGSGVDWLYGGENDDRLFGATEAVDSVDTDALFGEGGNDYLNGGGGDDGLDGGFGNDTLEGGAGVDWLYGSFGNDVLYGATETVDSDDTDALFGQEGNDTLNGGGGGDNLDGGSGDDELNGGAGNDWLFGQGDNDVLNGGDGLDVLFGNDGNDTLEGGAEGDALDGGAGADRLIGGAAVDVLFGGTGGGRVRVPEPGRRRGPGAGLRVGGGPDRSGRCGLRDRCRQPRGPGHLADGGGAPGRLRNGGPCALLRYTLQRAVPRRRRRHEHQRGRALRAGDGRARGGGCVGGVSGVFDNPQREKSSHSTTRGTVLQYDAGFRFLHPETY